MERSDSPFRFFETWLHANRVLHCRVESDGQPMAVSAAIESLCVGELGGPLSNFLARAPFEAFRWETPAWTATMPDRPFEFVLVDHPELERQPDPTAFASYFGSDLEKGEQKAGVASFPNLGGDSWLVVPEPTLPRRNFSQLAGFLRSADEEQRELLWRVVGRALLDRLNEEPVWLSSAGDGVPWLHLRLDDRPKYYAHGPYRQWPLPEITPSSVPQQPVEGGTMERAE